MKSRSFALLILGMLLMGSPAGAAGPTIPTTAASKYEAEKAIQGVPVSKDTWMRRATERVAWHRTRLRAAFERAGVKNPKWNDSMRALLDQVANLRGEGDLANRKKVEELVRQLHQLDCTDPLFRYLNTRYGDQSTRHEDPSAALRAASQGLRDSDYDALEKFWATYRTASQLKDKSRSKVPQEAVALFRTAVDLLATAFGNQELLADEVGSTSEELLIALKFDPVEYRAAWDKLVPLMTLHWPNSPHVLLAIGWGHLDRAWMARGNGYANTVTKEGGEGFVREMDQAEVCLTKSWSLEAMHRTTHQMMRLELGQGEGRERMELWFSRAMAMAPDDYEACVDKLRYLMPRWYGDHDEMLKFGRRCLTHPRWKGRVPLTLMRAHEFIAQSLPAEDQPAYWRKKEVWFDVRNSFERYFELNPENVTWRHNYAWFAWRAQDWDELNRQIPLLGEINYAYFGGQETYDRMVAEAKAREGTGPK